MSKHRNAWSAADRDEFEALCEEAWDSSPSQTVRTVAFVTGILDAQQAHRSWASDELSRITHRGALGTLKSWRKSKASVMFTHDGRVFTKAKTVGVSRIDSEGTAYSEQTLFEWLTIEELRAKAREAVATAQSWSASAGMFYQLVALCELAGADTPHAAAHSLGTTVEAWLEGVVAA